MIDFVLSDLRRVAEDFWPAGTAESWDRVGLVAGRNEVPLRRVLLALRKGLALNSAHAPSMSGLVIDADC